ncbi:CDP-alcohol phosphatidyltransferase family protein [Serinicoccus kebangsaanensis]|uniref:CDP-alcohol phosphatidyltransferase family protein n=1 Tax=Serinicoccus kebangsaanensis TaxID=2602069 RepID=UPI00124BE9DC|nr:CDP-alcohol phosphatidyltransferase family protein [Serinicoccus kebangsaanensis]
MADPSAATGPRPARPSLAQVRAVAQPPEILARGNAEHWTGDLYLRRLSPHLTRLLIPTPVTANGVTWLMMVAGWAAAGALLVPGLWGALAGALLAQLQMLLDCSDGEVARWKGMSGPVGIFLDKVGHYTVEGAIALALGLRAAGVVGGQEQDAATIWRYAFLGAALAAGLLLNKALNEMVHASRAAAGMGRLPDTAEARAVPATSLLGVLRRAARLLPFHRIFHSIEMTLLTLVVAVLGALAGDDLAAARWQVLAMAVLIVPVTLGHLAAILASPRLRAGAGR